MTACNADTGECGYGLICVCGLCSRACADDTECSALPSATCRAADQGLPQTCEAPAPPARCDVACTEDAECLAISSAHRCWSGYCRAGAAPDGGSGGSGGSGGTGGTDGTAGAGGEATGGACEVDGNQVLVLGDSFMATGHRITARVEELARQAGALEAAQRFRDESTVAVNALAPGPGIADQYTRAIEEAGVAVVIMNGGGADILLGVCENPSDPACPVIAGAVAGARELFQRMADDGVAHIVYAFYPDPPEGDLRAKMDTLRPLIETACSESPAPCHFLDLRPVFEGHYAEYVGPEGLNPTAAGAIATGDAIWATLQQACAAE